MTALAPAPMDDSAGRRESSSPATFRLTGGGAAWLVVLAAFTALWLFGGAAQWAFEYPKSAMLPVQAWISAAMKWLLDDAYFGL
ncbi:MAG: hypothetical protein MUE79_09355, partial [Nitratireductor sp.]|nr:hypothetical protein [Nitratireductor sp.]